MAFTLRTATATDADFLASMVVEAVNWLPERNVSRERIMADPESAHYVTGWPRPTDFGTVAVDPADAPIGAAWFRFFTADDPGYGFVGPDAPELTIGVAAQWRGQGVGRALLRATHEQARQAGLARVSLSVERGNPARRLYVAEGYRTVTSGRDSDTMVLDLRRRGG